MRKSLILIAPVLAATLVAGCKGKEPEAVAKADASAAAPAAVAMPALPANPKASVTVAGSYANAGATLKLGTDDSAELTGADGKVTKGKWAWYSDGKRILLTADKSVYAVADGGLFKLAGKDAPMSGFTADQLWAKAP